MPKSGNSAILRKFYEDEELYDEVYDYFFSHLDQLGLIMMYNKDDTHGIADAKTVLENAFKQLEELFTKGEKPKKQKNESR